MKPVVYVAHCYGGDPANRAAAAKWVAWVGKQGFAPVADWIILSGEWTEEEGRELGLEIDCALIRKCDAVLLTGPVISSGMLVEIESAKRDGVPVIDLTGMTFNEAAQFLGHQRVVIETLAGGKS